MNQIKSKPDVDGYRAIVETAGNSVRISVEKDGLSTSAVIDSAQFGQFRTAYEQEKTVRVGHVWADFEKGCTRGIVIGDDATAVITDAEARAMFCGEPCSVCEGAGRVAPSTPEPEEKAAVTSTVWIVERRGVYGQGICGVMATEAEARRLAEAITRPDSTDGDGYHAFVILRGDVGFPPLTVASWAAEGKGKPYRWVENAATPESVPPDAQADMQARLDAAWERDVAEFRKATGRGTPEGNTPEYEKLVKTRESLDRAVAELSKARISVYEAEKETLNAMQHAVDLTAAKEGAERITAAEADLSETPKTSPQPAYVSGPQIQVEQKVHGFWSKTPAPEVTQSATSAKPEIRIIQKISSDDGAWATLNMSCEETTRLLNSLQDALDRARLLSARVP